eukprot:5117883-Amphidinium_carterae.1
MLLEGTLRVTIVFTCWRSFIASPASLQEMITQGSVIRGTELAYDWLKYGARTISIALKEKCELVFCPEDCMLHTSTVEAACANFAH